MVTEIARQIGESPELIKEKRVQWASEILKRGVIVELHIGRTRFLRKMTKEDLGLDISDLEFQRFLEEYYDLGSKLLLPKKALVVFNRIEGRGRNNLYRYSFSSPWGTFVPATAYAKWKEENEKIKAEYFDEARKLRNNIDILKAEILNEYRAAAHKLYERTSRQKSLEEFTEDFIENIETQIPGVDEIAASFNYRENIYYIPLPSEVEEEFLKAELFRKEAVLEQARTRAEAEKYAAEVLMHKDAVAKVLEMKKQKIDSMMDSVSEQLRGAIFSTLRDVLEGIKSRAVLTGSSVKSLKSLVERTKLMNFMGDTEIEGALGKIEDVLGQKSQKRDIGNVAAVFHDIAKEFRAYALDGDDLPEIREFGLL